MGYGGEACDAGKPGVVGLLRGFTALSELRLHCNGQSDGWCLPPVGRAAPSRRTAAPHGNPAAERERAQPSLLPLPASEGECVEAYVQAARGYDEVLPGLETAEGARTTGPGLGFLRMGTADSEGGLTLSARATLPCRENRTMGCSSSTAASSAAQPVSLASNQVPSFILGSTPCPWRPAPPLGSLTARTVSFIL